MSDTPRDGEGRDPGEAGETGEAPEGRTETPGLGRTEARRFPGWLLLPLGGLAGWVVSGWAGAILGALVGGFVWRSRA